MCGGRVFAAAVACWGLNGRISSGTIRTQHNVVLWQLSFQRTASVLQGVACGKLASSCCCCCCC